MKLGTRRGPVLAAAAVGALLAVLAVVPLLERGRQPATGSAPDRRAAPVTTPHLPGDVDWKQIRRDKGRQVTCAADDVSACTVHRGAGPHVLLVGDSHAVMMTQMFTRLAEKHDFTLSVNALLGCPWQENLENVQSGPPRRKECTRARVGWYDDVLPKLHPDVVVVASFAREDPKHWATRLVQRDGRHDPLHRAELSATRDTLHKIERSTRRVLLVQQVITAKSFDPDACMIRTGDPSRCAVPVPLANSVTDGFYLTEATEHPDVFTVNLNPAFCPGAPLCEPVVDGHVVWRDAEHLTPGYATSRKDRVWRRIEKSGVLRGLV